MNVCVRGQGVLAETTAACCRPHVTVTSNVHPGTNLIWFCYDTPIAHDEAEFWWVLDRIDEDLEGVAEGAHILVSSQLPVGTIARLEMRYPQHAWAYSPENIRTAHAFSDFLRQDRIVVGYRSPVFEPLVRELFAPFTHRLILTDPETAEMVKHALNAYLGMNIAYINEIARVAKAVGADIGMIEAALLTERRVSPMAPLHAGKPFGNGHLARDLQVLNDLSGTYDLYLPVLWGILPSNEAD